MMTKIKLELKDRLANEIKQEAKVVGSIPVEAANITPDNFKDKSQAELKEIDLFVGNERMKLKDFFIIKGEYSDKIEIDGDLVNFKRVGQEMTQGEIEINGNVGLHTGAKMSGGKIKINGNASDWLGAEMTGGVIEVSGQAGDYIGAAYRGNKLGMNRGVIIIHGSAGDFIGQKMRRGEILVFGEVGDFVGAEMIAGSIYLFGPVGKRIGAGMKRGSIVLFEDFELLPTFRYSNLHQADFLTIAFNSLKKRFGLEIDEEYLKSKYHRYVGDINTLGKGEILQWQK